MLKTVISMLIREYNPHIFNNFKIDKIVLNNR